MNYIKKKETKTSKTLWSNRYIGSNYIMEISCKHIVRVYYINVFPLFAQLSK